MKKELQGHKKKDGKMFYLWQEVEDSLPTKEEYLEYMGKDDWDDWNEKYGMRGLTPVAREILKKIKKPEEDIITKEEYMETFCPKNTSLRELGDTFIPFFYIRGFMRYFQIIFLIFIILVLLGLLVTIKW